MLKQGIYEHIINQETDRRMQEAEQSGLVCVQQAIDDAESPQMLANYLANAIRQKLEDTEERQDRVNLINRIMIDAGLLDDKQIVKHTDLLAEVMSHQQAVMTAERLKKSLYPYDPKSHKYFCYVFDEEVTLGNIDINELLTSERIYNKTYEEGEPIFKTCEELIEYRK